MDPEHPVSSPRKARGTNHFIVPLQGGGAVNYNRLAVEDVKDVELGTSVYEMKLNFPGSPVSEVENAYLAGGTDVR